MFFSTHPKIFISYRRHDSSGHAGRLYDDLIETFSEETVTKDIEKIQAGENYESVIETQIITSDVLLVIIGTSWISSAQNGKRRLDDPEDLVSKEISLAFKNKVLIIPVLVQGAQMPKKEELPDELKGLAGVNAIELSDSRWKYDVKRIIKRLNNIHRPKRNYKPLLIGVISILVLSLLAYFIFQDKPPGNKGGADITKIDSVADTLSEDSIPGDTSRTNPKPIDIVGAGFTADAFRQYLPALRFRDWKPEFVVLHNTVLPTFAQWHKKSAESRLKTFADYFGLQHNWKSGPHLFVADDSIWVFNDLDRPGIHSPSWNKISFGVEMVGDYTTEPFNKAVENNAVRAVAALFHRLKMPANDSTIRFHSEDPKARQKICPGKNVIKADFIKKVDSLLKLK